MSLSCSRVRVLLIITLLGIFEQVKERVQEIRLDPPEGLQRTPGPVAILYDFQRDQALRASGKRLPRSTRTIWLILDAAGLIERDSLRRRSVHEPPEPLEEVPMDFKDVSTVPTDLHDADAKRAHVIETCNFVDAGTSLLLDAQVHEDFHARLGFSGSGRFLTTLWLPQDGDV
jgi:hypothetical protein